MSNKQLALVVSNTLELIELIKAKRAKAEQSLAALDDDMSTHPEKIVAWREQLEKSIKDCDGQLEVLATRRTAEVIAQEKRDHAAKVARVDTATKKRLTYMVIIDKALTIIGDAAENIDALDADVIMPDVAGIDSRFDLQRRMYTIAILNKLGSLGIGTDKRMDKSAPAIDLKTHAAKFHENMISELQSHGK